MISQDTPSYSRGGDGERAGAISSAKGLHALLACTDPKSRWGVGKIIFPTSFLHHSGAASPCRGIEDGGPDMGEAGLRLLDEGERPGQPDRLEPEPAGEQRVARTLARPGREECR